VAQPDVFASAQLDTGHIENMSRNLQIHRFKRFNNLTVIIYVIISGTGN